MKSQRPYLLRALYQWVVDCDEVPYVLVDASISGVQVPQQHVEDGQIVLNLGPNAVRDLVLGDEFVMCSSRFDGMTFELVLPIESVKAIYCKDTGAGMVFPEELSAAQKPSDVELKPSPVEAVANSDPDPDKPTLRLV
ncbi:MAG: ClpXP protease specificity-enhancing factor [Gammaproteobacteria bacterium]|nr:ClpXP protease specificity-enhancing factor [Gammaproteobacteria bacterium]